MRYKNFCIAPIDPGTPEQKFQIHPPRKPRKVLAEEHSVAECLELIDIWESQLALFPKEVSAHAGR